VSERVTTHSSHGEMHDVRLVDDRRDGLDLSTELLLDLVQVEAVVVGDEIDGQAQVAEAARATDTMQVGLGVLGKVKIDDDVHGLNVDTSGEEVCAIARASRSVSHWRTRCSLPPSLPPSLSLPLSLSCSSTRTGAHQVPAQAVTEVVEDTVAVRLEHLGVDVEARVAKLGDLFGEQLDAVD